jgi:hypothetical protein
MPKRRTSSRFCFASCERAAASRGSGWGGGGGWTYSGNLCPQCGIYVSAYYAPPPRAAAAPTAVCYALSLSLIPGSQFLRHHTPKLTHHESRHCHLHLPPPPVRGCRATSLLLLLLLLLPPFFLRAACCAVALQRPQQHQVTRALTPCRSTCTTTVTVTVTPSRRSAQVTGRASSCSVRRALQCSAAASSAELCRSLQAPTLQRPFPCRLGAVTSTSLRYFFTHTHAHLLPAAACVTHWQWLRRSILKEGPEVRCQ